MLGRGGWQACPHTPPLASSVTHGLGVASSRTIWDDDRSAHSLGSWLFVFLMQGGDKMYYNPWDGGLPLSLSHTD